MPLECVGYDVDRCFWSAAKWISIWDKSVEIMPPACINEATQLLFDRNLPNRVLPPGELNKINI